MLARLRRLVERVRGGGTNPEGVQPMSVAVAQTSRGMTLLVFTFGDRQMLALLPRPSAVQLVDRLLDVLQIGDEDDTEPGPETVH